MKEEFNLSRRLWRSDILKHNLELVSGLEIKNRGEFYFAEDVKEFIRLLKKEAKEHDDTDSHLEDGYPFNPDCNMSFIHMIDKLAGEKLR